MRSAKNSLREAEDSVFAPSASTEVHRCRPFAVLKVSGVVVCWQPKR